MILNLADVTDPESPKVEIVTLRKALNTPRYEVGIKGMGRPDQTDHVFISENEVMDALTQYLNGGKRK